VETNLVDRKLHSDYQLCFAEKLCCGGQMPQFDSVLRQFWKKMRNKKLTHYQQLTIHRSTTPKAFGSDPADRADRLKGDRYYRLE
jgi:hypothetical protein